MHYIFRVSERKETFITIKSDSEEQAQLEANNYVESGQFDIDKNQIDAVTRVELDAKCL